MNGLVVLKKTQVAVGLAAAHSSGLPVIAWFRGEQGTAVAVAKDLAE